MDPEVKKILDELTRTFAEFRQANDERWEAEKKGKASDPILTEKVDKLNAAIDTISDRLRTAETVANRTSNPAQDSKEARAELDNARQFLALVRNVPIENVQAADLETVRAYRPHFVNYLRRGSINDAMSVGSSPDGGYWVLPDTTGRIVQLVFETSPMRRLADVQPIGTDALEGMYDNDEVTDGGWVGENGDRSADTATPQIGRWRIEAQEQWAQPKATQKFLDDAFVDVEAWLTKKVASKLSRVENKAYILGNGVAQPRGILAYPVGTPTKAAFMKVANSKTGVNNAFAAASPGDIFIDTLAALKADYRQGAAWLGTRTTRAAIRKLKDGQGNYLWLRDFTSSAGTMELDSPLLGHPFYEMADMPEITAAAASAFAIACGDFRQAYQIVDRYGIRVLRDPLTAKGFVKFYTTRRVGGGVVNFEAYRTIQFSA
jgi:HK97 family phage major capsid protein